MPTRVFQSQMAISAPVIISAVMENYNNKKIEKSIYIKDRLLNLIIK